MLKVTLTVVAVFTCFHSAMAETHDGVVSIPDVSRSTSAPTKGDSKNVCEPERPSTTLAQNPAPTRPSAAPQPPRPPRPSQSALPQVDSGGLNPGPPQWRALMDIHRDERSKVAVQPIQWSDRLAKDAQAWADRCDFSHTPNMKDGQNLYASSNPNEALAEAGRGAARGWADEKTDFSAQTNQCAPGKVCGHYTQMVWRGTTEVGCAHKQCPNGVAGFPSGVIVVCNYAPPGNFVGQRPF